MKYTVVWDPAADDELINLWLRAADRDALTIAVDKIEKRLRGRPEDAGESRSQGRRILIEPPVAVTFEVFMDDRLVRVLDVWRFESGN